MSHQWNCPDRWEAEREGERAQEWGRSQSSNPYEDDYWNRDKACPEAEEAWDRGYRRAEMRADEDRAEEAARQRAAMHRAEAEAEESYYMQQAADDYAQAQEYYASLQEQELAELESQPSPDAVDPDAGVSSE